MQMSTMWKMTNSALGPGPLHAMACQSQAGPVVASYIVLTMGPLPVV